MRLLSGELIGSMYFFDYLPYICVGLDDGRTIHRRAFDIDRKNRTANIRINKKMERVRYYFG